MFVLKFTDFGLADVRALPKNVKNSLKKELRNKVAQNPEACSEELHGPLKDYRSFHFRDPDRVSDAGGQSALGA